MWCVGEEGVVRGRCECESRGVEVDVDGRAEEGDSAEGYGWWFMEWERRDSRDCKLFRNS